MPFTTAGDKPLPYPCLLTTAGDTSFSLSAGSSTSLRADELLPYPNSAMRQESALVSYSRRKRIRLPADAYRKPETWYFVTICCRNKKPLFESTQVRDLVQEVLRQTASASRVELAAYTILPNHLHLICSAGVKGLSSFIRGFKGRTTAEIRKRYRKPSPWQARFFDHKIRSDESLQQKCEYVWMNPARRGLVRNPESYPWSGGLLSG